MLKVRIRNITILVIAAVLAVIALIPRDSTEVPDGILIEYADSMGGPEIVVRE